MVLVARINLFSSPSVDYIGNQKNIEYFLFSSSDVSSELGARLRVELEQTERLDAQFLEYLHCRGMNPAVNTDSAAGSMSYNDDLLAPELQVGVIATRQ